MNSLKNLLVVLTLVSLTSVVRVLAQPRFEIPLVITDSATTWTMHFGVFPGAHYCIDYADTINGQGEFLRGPWPPFGLESYFTSPNTVSEYTDCFPYASPNDFRPFTSYAQKDTFRVRVSPWGYPTLSISWPSGLSAYFNELVLKDVLTGGAMHTVNMLTTTSVDFSDVTPPRFWIYATGPHNPLDTTTVQVHYRAGWNLISNPFKIVIPGDSVKQLFPMSLTPYAFEYSSGYVQSYRLVHGKGYWLKLPSETSVTFRGIGYANDTISVQGSWNLIGTAFYPVPVDSVRTIPPGIITSWFFGMGSSSYSRADTLAPGKGYCVRVSQPGLIVLPGGN